MPNGRFGNEVHRVNTLRAQADLPQSESSPHIHGTLTKHIEAFSRGSVTGQIFVEYNGAVLRFRVLATVSAGRVDNYFDDIESARKFVEGLA